MSFIIAVYVGEGIVLASDSRTSYTNSETVGNKTIHKIGIHVTDTTDKTFLCPNGSGISTCGDACINGIPITGSIQAFIREKIDEYTLVSEIPKLIIDYFHCNSYVPDTNFIIAGYQEENGKLVQKVYKTSLKDKSIEQVNQNNSQGASWDGETLILTKLIIPMAEKKQNGTYTDLPHSSILWNYFTMQDAIDFAKYAAETTINTMHFQNVPETVGKPIDILVIQPKQSYWAAKKKIYAN